MCWSLPDSVLTLVLRASWTWRAVSRWPGTHSGRSQVSRDRTGEGNPSMVRSVPPPVHSSTGAAPHSLRDPLRGLHSPLVSPVPPTTSTTPPIVHKRCTSVLPVRISHTHRLPHILPSGRPRSTRSRRFPLSLGRSGKSRVTDVGTQTRREEIGDLPGLETERGV